MMSVPEPAFADLGLGEPFLTTLDELGYETPSSIQAAAIPPLLAGRDVAGQAQTGTGKTAAFALPLLTRLDLSQARPQILVLTPTRELAIQVAEAFQRYAAKLKGFHVAPIYGGQSYEIQLRRLRRAPHAVIGTPGRVMDFMRRGALDLGGVAALVLDEADEMLRMGFQEDVSWILEQTPPERQTTLFSATMPAPIRRIAKQYMREPVEITVKTNTVAAETVRQRYWSVSGYHKLEALTRILEVEDFDGMIIFVRTKTMTAELAEKLEARGFAAAALSGDMSQALRERTVAALKSGKVDILVATDVAARGLDVERISHVVNYDIPYDAEAYVHRIGRTGRAGRGGEAILFVAPREKRQLAAIERSLKTRLERMAMPTVEAVNDQRIQRFKQRISDTLAEADLDFFEQLIDQFQSETDTSAREIAAALARLLHGDAPFLLPPERARPQREGRRERAPSGGPRTPSSKLARYRIAVGRAHGVKIGNIVGAIANEGGVEVRDIGRVEIRHSHSLVELPPDLPPDAMSAIARARVAGRQLAIVPDSGPPSPGKKPPAAAKKPKPTAAKATKKAAAQPPAAQKTAEAKPGSDTAKKKPEPKPASPKKNAEKPALEGTEPPKRKTAPAAKSKPVKAKTLKALQRKKSQADEA